MNVARWAWSGAGLALVVWSPLRPFGLVESLVALAAASVVPLGLSLAEDSDRHGRHLWPYRAATTMLPFAIAAAVASFVLPPGWPAGALAGTWCLFCMVVGSFGVARFLRRGFRYPEELAIDLGLVYLTIGGVWLTASRAGVGLLGFGEPIVLLTAAHFHYAGFAAPVLSGTAVKLISHPGERPSTVCSLALACVCAGVPLTAIGITTNHSIERVSVGVLVVGMLAMGGLLVGRVAPIAWKQRLTRARFAAALLTLAGLSLAVTMALALAFATSGAGRSSHFDGPVSVGRMIEVHGILNAIGFTMCGLLALVLLRPEGRCPPAGIPFSRLASRGVVGANFFERTGVASAGGVAHGLVEDLDAYEEGSFRPADVDPRVRAFYEQTARHRLEVTANWSWGFRFGGKVWKAVAGQIDQLALPTSRADERVLVSSRIVALNEDVDGRPGARGWVRTIQETGGAIYVAAYALHRDESHAYMNIAFPLPGGSLTSILRFEHAASGSIVLRTASPRGEPHGDEGIYLVTPWLPIRLPMAESIAVWVAEDGARPLLRARHEMRVLGCRYLVLDYEIFG